MTFLKMPGKLHDKESQASVGLFIYLFFSAGNGAQSLTNAGQEFYHRAIPSAPTRADLIVNQRTDSTTRSGPGKVPGMRRIRGEEGRKGNPE